MNPQLYGMVNPSYQRPPEDGACHPARDLVCSKECGLMGRRRALVVGFIFLSCTVGTLS